MTSTYSLSNVEYITHLIYASMGLWIEVLDCATLYLCGYKDALQRWQSSSTGVSSALMIKCYEAVKLINKIEKLLCSSVVMLISAVMLTYNLLARRVVFEGAVSLFPSRAIEIHIACIRYTLLDRMEWQEWKH